MRKMKDKYHIADEDEILDLGFRDVDGCEGKLLVGPNGFYCFLGEPEDNIWSRNFSDIVEELNRLYELFIAAVDNV